MSFDVDLGALSTFVATENEVRFAPSVFLIDPGNPVDCQRPRLWDRYLAELGGWRASHVKKNQASYHCKCECRGRKLRIADIVILRDSIVRQYFR